MFDAYIRKGRKELMRYETDALVISIRSDAVTVGEVCYLIEQFRPLFPGRTLIPGTIRQSVIANWLNEKRFSLETVQLMAGHKWISSTARYRRSNMDEKREQINRWHPMG